MAEIFEAVMVVCFGLSWPANIVKSWRARTARGKSLIFLLLVWTGYIAGIASKLIAGTITYVFAFYVLNFAMVSVDIGLYVRNTRLDKAR